MSLFANHFLEREREREREMPWACKTSETSSAQSVLETGLLHAQSAGKGWRGQGVVWRMLALPSCGAWPRDAEDGSAQAGNTPNSSGVTLVVGVKVPHL
jgi:hypothetical protein